jgi:hypothetical protein
MSQLGRIGGQVLADNLLRAGVDLAFENDLLYLDVENQRVGIRQGVPIYDLDVNSNIKTTELTVTNQFSPGTIRVTAPNTFSTSVGGINVYISGSEIFHDRLVTNNLVFNDNTIGSLSNSNIVFAPNKTGTDPLLHGTVEIRANTNITGDLAVTGSINISGNLSTPGTVTVGNNILEDTVTVNTDFTQDIALGNNELYTLGTPLKRWDRVYVEDWTKIGSAGNGIVATEIVVSDQLRFNGTLRTITSLQSNDDVVLTSSTGTTILEDIAWNANNILNLNNTPLLLSSSGIGYYQFDGTNGMVFPSGDNSQRRLTPELGETRWNTEELYLECFNGEVWTISTGAGEEVTEELAEDINNVWILTLG